jgi:predicted ArsR family transcriptional regulator
MSERRRATPDEVKALSHPLRLRVLALCQNESLSNKELADRLRQQPATLLHHVRTLVRTGFLVADPVRRGPRGSTVRPYRATDKSWTIDIGGPRETTGAKIAAVDAAFAEMHAAPSGELGPLLLYSVRASRAQLEKVMDSVVAELETVEAATEGTEEPVWNLLFATYPASR